MENLILQKDSGATDSYLLQKKIEIMMELSHKKIKSELDSIKEMITRLEGTVSEIKRCLGTANAKTEFNAAPAPNIPARESPTAARQNEEKTNSPNAQSEDVSIEKFFYFGKKGK